MLEALVFTTSKDFSERKRERKRVKSVKANIIIMPCFLSYKSKGTKKCLIHIFPFRNFSIKLIINAYLYNKASRAQLSESWKKKLSSTRIMLRMKHVIPHIHIQKNTVIFFN